jgi:hypothetical protein
MVDKMVESTVELLDFETAASTAALMVALTADW